jgi:hypothetical protein
LPECSPRNLILEPWKCPLDDDVGVANVGQEHHMRLRAAWWDKVSAEFTLRLMHRSNPQGRCRKLIWPVSGIVKGSMNDQYFIPLLVVHCSRKALDSCKLWRMENWIFKTLRRGTDEYEAARKKAVWNGRVPPRYPEIIAFPTCDAEVVECVIYAKTVGMSIGTKSGGHSWTASFLREGGMLLGLVGMKEISPDIARKVCEIQPGAYGADLNALIGPKGQVGTARLSALAASCCRVDLAGTLGTGAWLARVYSRWIA